MPTFTLLPSALYQPGTQAANRAIPSGLTLATFSIDVSQMLDPAQNYDVLLDLSLDGGLTFASQYPNDAMPPQFGVYPMRVHRIGGSFVDKNGNPLTAHNIPVPLPDPTNPNRVGRAAITINDRPITLGVSITI